MLQCTREFSRFYVVSRRKSFLARLLLYYPFSSIHFRFDSVNNFLFGLMKLLHWWIHIEFTVACDCCCTRITQMTILKGTFFGDDKERESEKEKRKLFVYLYCASIPWNYQQTFLWIISSVSSAYKIYEIRAVRFNCFRASARFVLYMHIAHFKFHISIPNSRKVSREFDANLQIHDPIYRLHTVVMKYHRSYALYKWAPRSFPNDAPIYIFHTVLQIIINSGEFSVNNAHRAFGGLRWICHMKRTSL